MDPIELDLPAPVTPSSSSSDALAKVKSLLIIYEGLLLHTHLVSEKLIEIHYQKGGKNREEVPLSDPKSITPQ